MSGKVIVVTEEFGGDKVGDVLTNAVVSGSIWKGTRADGSIGFIPVTNCQEDSTVAPVSPKPSVSLTVGDEEVEIINKLMNGETVSRDSVKPPKPEPTREERIRFLLNYEGDEPLLNEGQFWLSDLTGGVLPDSGVDHKITAYPMSDWTEDEQADIPDVQVEYSWNANILEALLLSYVMDAKILITGLPGTGKTTAIKQFSAHIQQPFMRMNGNAGMEASSLLGYPWATSEGMVWKDGLLPQGIKQGYLVCIDEVFKIPAGIQMAMQALYEKGGKLLLDDKPGEYHDKLVEPAPSFRLMLTDNVKGTGDNFEKFSATQMQDTSTLDRIDITIELDYLPKNVEIQMLMGMFPAVEPKTIAKLVKFAGLVRAGYKSGEIALTLSPRGLVATLGSMESLGIPVAPALAYSFANKVAEKTEVQAIRKMMDAAGLK